MRLFFAVNFGSCVKDPLAAVQNDLRRQTLAGNFTLYENLHLTLVFIGEVTEKPAETLLQITRSIRFKPFMLRFDHLGRFKRDGGELIWVGVEKSEPLLSLYEMVAGQVRSAGFTIETRPYTPHLTLARGVRHRDGFSLTDYSRTLKPITAPVQAASLMRSERVNGWLTYTELGQSGRQPDDE